MLALRGRVAKLGEFIDDSDCFRWLNMDGWPNVVSKACLVLSVMIIEDVEAIELCLSDESSVIEGVSALLEGG